MSETVSIETSRFGRIEADSESVLHFSAMPGFSGARRFVVVDHSETNSFSWLISLDDPKLAFVIANPWHFFPGYDPAIEPRHLKGLEIKETTDLETVVMAIFQGRKVMLNLSAPLLINRESRKCTQVILDDPRYSTREEVLPFSEKRVEREAGAQLAQGAPE